MGRWLNQLRGANFSKTPGGPTDKTDETPFSIGSVSSVSTPSGPFQNFHGWDEADWHFAFEERAAILEYDEGLPRAEAEALAAEQIAQQRRQRLQ